MTNSVTPAVPFGTTSACDLAASAPPSRAMRIAEGGRMIALRFAGPHDLSPLPPNELSSMPLWPDAKACFASLCGVPSPELFDWLLTQVNAQSPRSTLFEVHAMQLIRVRALMGLSVIQRESMSGFLDALIHQELGPDRQLAPGSVDLGHEAARDLSRDALESGLSEGGVGLSTGFAAVGYARPGADWFVAASVLCDPPREAELGRSVRLGHLYVGYRSWLIRWVWSDDLMRPILGASSSLVMSMPQAVGVLASALMFCPSDGERLLRELSTND